MYLQVPQQKNPYLFPKFSVFVGSIEIAEQNVSGELFLEFLFVNYFCINPLMHNSKNGQTHFKNLAVFAARCLKCV